MFETRSRADGDASFSFCLSQRYEEATATVYTVINFTPLLYSLANSISFSSTTPPNENPEIIDLAVQKMLDEKVFLKPTGETMADPIKRRFRLIFTQKPETMKVSCPSLWFGLGEERESKTDEHSTFASNRWLFDGLRRRLV